MIERHFNCFSDVRPSLGSKLNYKLFKKYIPREGWILDVGCWAGQYESLIPNKKALHVVGIDPSKEAVRYAREHIKNVDFTVSTAERYQSNKRFNLILLLDVLEHVPAGSEQRLLSKLGKYLVKGGKLVIVTPSSHVVSVLLDPAYFLIQHRHYDVTTIRSLLVKSGLHVIEEKKVGDIVCVITRLIDLLSKHIIGRQFGIYDKFSKIIERRYTKNGFDELLFISEKT